MPQDNLSLEFSRWLGKRLINKLTVKQYVSAVNVLLKKYEITDFESLKSLSDKELLQRLADTITERERCYHRKYAYRQLLIFLGRDNLCFDQRLPTVSQRPRRQLKKDISFDQIRKLVDYADLKHKLIIMLQYDTSCRISAILKLKKGSISHDGKFTKITVEEKRNKLKTAYLSPKTAGLLEEYTKENWIEKDKDFIFTSDRKSQYHEVWETMRKIAKESIGIELSSHWFRHSRAIHLFEKGYDLMTVSDFLGHSSLASTKPYLESAGIKSKQIMKKERLKW